MSGLRHFRSLVSDEVAHQIACSIVGSRLDYCNSLLLNCSNRNLDKLQRVQNNLARVVCISCRLTLAEPLLRSLHRLPVPVRQGINYKLANLCYLAIFCYLSTSLPCSSEKLKSVIRYTKSGIVNRKADFFYKTNRIANRNALPPTAPVGHCADQQH